MSAVAFSPDGKLLALGEYGGQIVLATVSRGTIVTTLTDPPNKLAPNSPDSASPEFATFSHDGKILATGDGDGRTYLWSVTNHHLITTLIIPGSELAAGSAPNALFSPADDTLATTDSDGNVYLWNVVTRKVTAKFTPPDFGAVLGIGFSPNGRMLAICEGRTTYLWRPN